MFVTANSERLHVPIADFPQGDILSDYSTAQSRDAGVDAVQAQSSAITPETTPLVLL